MTQELTVVVTGATGKQGGAVARGLALDDVREAYRQVELRHTRGKLVLRP